MICQQQHKYIAANAKYGNLLQSHDNYKKNNNMKLHSTSVTLYLTNNNCKGTQSRLSSFQWLALDTWRMQSG